VSVNKKSFYLVPAGYNYNAPALLINFQRDRSFGHCKPFSTSKNQILQIHHVMVYTCSAMYVWAHPRSTLQSSVCQIALHCMPMFSYVVCKAFFPCWAGHLTLGHGDVPLWNWQRVTDKAYKTLCKASNAIALAGYWWSI